MNALRIWKQFGLDPAMWLSLAVALAVGCQDPTLRDSTPALESLNSETAPGGTGDLLHASSEEPSGNMPAGLASSGTTPPDAASSGDASSGAASSGAASSGAVSSGAVSSAATSADPLASGTLRPGTGESTAPQPGKSPGVTLPAKTAPKTSVALPAVKPAEIYEPKVVLSRSHEQTCLVAVGDAMPNLALQRATGEPVTLDELRGEQLTVVVFWSNRFVFGRAQFQRLAAEVALPFRHLGVKVVAVNVGDPVEQIELDEVAKDEVVSVFDPTGAETAKVATGKLPRTYLLDSSGRILWFDIEYSRMMRRQLKNAIFYFSGEVAAAAS